MRAAGRGRESWLALVIRRQRGHTRDSVAVPRGTETLSRKDSPDWEWNLAQILHSILTAVADKDWTRVENEAERLKDWARTCRKQLRDGKFNEDE